MNWYSYISCFLAGAFLANTVPHFVKGVCGDPFPTPFANPPGKGLSSPLVNVLWALVNLGMGCFLFHAGNVSSGGDWAMILFFAGLAGISIQLSVHFSHKDSGGAPPLSSPPEARDDR